MYLGRVRRCNTFIMCFRILVLLVLVACEFSHAQERGKIMIGSASDLKFALDSIVAAYGKEAPAVQVQVSYGSSGKLFEQISNGAPFDIYFSADRAYALKLKENGKAISEVITYGFGRIVIWSRHGNRVKEGSDFLLSPEIRKIAIANPLHAPYGRAAEQALKSFGIYDKVTKKLVFGENISQAAQFVTGGAADAGIIALSLALSPAMQNAQGAFYLIPASAHQPLEQAYVILGHAQGNAQVAAFAAFLKTDTVQQILSYFGFSMKP
jgi:molybdate transport system substrate-binding protein